MIESESTIEQLFKDALKKNTSDIHIEVRYQKSIIRFRSNGEFIIYKTLLPIEGIKLINLIHSEITSNPIAFENDVFDKMLDKIRVRARVALSPSIPNGFDMVIRIFLNNEDFKSTPLDKLGYSIEEQDNIKSIALNAKN